MKKCIIIGKFAINKNVLDGQTVKCENIYNELIDRYGNDNVTRLDTYGWKKRPLRLFFNCLRGMKNHEHVIIMPAQNGVKVFAPLLTYYKILFKRKLHYIVIGSWLFDKVKSSKKTKKALLKFDSIFVETTNLKSSLQSVGFNNVILMNNYKKLKINGKYNMFKTKKVLRICIFSRINKEKGILDAINSIKIINSNEKKFELDIYGMIEKEFKNELNLELEKCKNNIKYKGIINSGNSVDVIRNYDLLIFPTKYVTEGIPGTIIDAYAAGVPVLVSSWENYKDVVLDKKTGLVFRINDFDDLVTKLNYIYGNQKKIYDMKKNCIARAKLYCSIEALYPLFDAIDGR